MGMAEVPSIASLVFHLQRCRALKNLDYAKCLHAFACNNGLDSHSAVGNHLVPLFVECESVPEAQKVFYRLIEKKEHSWTSLMNAHIQFGRPKLALQLYREMLEHGIDSSSFTLVALLNALSHLKDVDHGREIHSQIYLKGFDGEDSVGSMLVKFYAKCGSLHDAAYVFEGLSIRPSSAWNSLIHGYVEHGEDKVALSSFGMMEDDGVCPDPFTFSCVLKACAGSGAVIHGQGLHKAIIEKGFESDLSVGNTLIDMYAKAGMLSEARYLFHSMAVRDVVTWTSMIAGFSDPEFAAEEAVRHYDEMWFEGLHPNSITIMCVLKACANIKSVDKGQDLYSELVCCGLESDIAASNTLLAMYAKCGSWTEARHVLEKLPVKGPVSWTALTVGYAEHGCFDEVLACFEEMKRHDIFVDASLFSCILKACAGLKASEDGQRIHMDVVCKGFESDRSVGNSLISMYARCGFISEAEKVLKGSKGRDSVSWTAIASGYAEAGLAEDVQKCMESMQLEGMTPDPNFYACALKACIGCDATRAGHELHTDIVTCGCENEAQVGNALIDLYSKLGSVAEMQLAFESLQMKDIVSWTALITGYADRGLNEEVRKRFREMMMMMMTMMMQGDGVSANAFTVACVLKACGNAKQGRELHSMVIQEGLETEPSVGSSVIDMYARCGFICDAKEAFDMLPPVREAVCWTALLSGYVDAGLGEEALDSMMVTAAGEEAADAVALSCCLKACASTGARSKGQGVHMEMAKKGFDGDVVVMNSLVCFYCDCGLGDDARRVVGTAAVCDAPAWTSLVARYSAHETAHHALRLYAEMSSCVIPVAETLACVLKACACAGAMRRGRDLHRDAVQRGMEAHLCVANSLINMYAKCGATRDAEAVFEGLRDDRRDVVSWSAMVAGYAANHEAEMAVRCFRGMREHGRIEPDTVSFTCVLNACRHNASLASTGKHYFYEMEEAERKAEQYACMVDILAKSGELADAERLLALLPPAAAVASSERTQAALLSACRTLGDANVGRRCFNSLVAARPDTAAWYVLMSEIYSRSGRMEDARRIEELRRRRCARKKPASALIELSNMQVHEFVVGSRSSRSSRELVALFASRLQLEGHVPDLDLVPQPAASDASKASLLCVHAEKLAIAFGLLHTAPGETLRVTKNLRMCANCHDATKIISRIEKREIIVRDTCCIHHFRNGSCSCSDMF